MSEPLRSDTRARRGRFEMRTILLLVLAVVALGAIVSLIFGAQGDGGSSVDAEGPPLYPAAQPQG